MFPYTASEIVRTVASEATSALPDAPVRPDADQSAGPTRGDRIRLGLGLALRRLADRIEPARRPTPTVSATARR